MLPVSNLGGAHLRGPSASRGCTWVGWRWAGHQVSPAGVLRAPCFAHANDNACKDACKTDEESALAVMRAFLANAGAARVERGHRGEQHRGTYPHTAYDEQQRQ